MFRQLNLEKPTKWFLNLSSDKQSTDSPSNKLKKYCDKYKDTNEWGKKYEKPEEMQRIYTMPSKTYLMPNQEERMFQLKTSSKKLQTTQKQWERNSRTLRTKPLMRK